MAGNNKDNVESFDKPSVVYYSYVKTDTHAYLGYHFYFPTRWSSAIAFGTNIENVFRSVLMVIDLTTDSPYGDLVLMETSTENYLYRYLPEESELLGAFMDGVIEMDNSGGHPRPVLYLNSENHAIYGSRATAGWDDEGFPGDSGGILRWDFESDVVNGLLFDANYSMIELVSTLWPERNNLGDLEIFESFGFFAGDDATDESLAPWAMKDALEGAEAAGEIVYDPATLVSRHFPVGWGVFSFQYTYNPYAMRVDVESLEIIEIGGLFETSDVDPYVSLWLRDGRGEEKKVLGFSGGNQNNWSISTIESGTVLDMKAELGRYWFYGLQVGGYEYFGIDIRDEDWGLDGWLMDPSDTSYHSFVGTAALDWVESKGTLTVQLP